MQRPVQLLPDAQLQKTPGSRISVRKHIEQPGKRKDRRAVGIKLPDTFAASASEANTEADSDNRDACRTAFDRDWQAEAYGSPNGIFPDFTRGSHRVTLLLARALPVCCGLNLWINCVESPTVCFTRAAVWYRNAQSEDD